MLDFDLIFHSDQGGVAGKRAGRRGNRLNQSNKNVCAWFAVILHLDQGGGCC